MRASDSITGEYLDGSKGFRFNHVITGARWSVVPTSIPISFQSQRERIIPREGVLIVYPYIHKANAELDARVRRENGILFSLPS